MKIREIKCPDIPDELAARFVLLNPVYSAQDAKLAIAAMYGDSPTHMPMTHWFNIPRDVVHEWMSIAHVGIDVCPTIGAFLDSAGIPSAPQTSTQQPTH